MTVRDFRPLTDDERALIDALLTSDFDGSNEIRAQLDSAFVRALDEDCSLEFKVEGAPKAHVKRRIPIEAEVEDEDGRSIHILLHVVDGVVDELEVYREDGSPVRRRPVPEDVSLVLLG